MTVAEVSLRQTVPVDRNAKVRSCHRPRGLPPRLDQHTRTVSLGAIALGRGRQIADVEIAMLGASRRRDNQKQGNPEDPHKTP
jgi:hypothetical protein